MNPDALEVTLFILRDRRTEMARSTPGVVSHTRTRHRVSGRMRLRLLAGAKRGRDIGARQRPVWVWWVRRYPGAVIQLEAVDRLGDRLHRRELIRIRVHDGDVRRPQRL